MKRLAVFVVALAACNSDVDEPWQLEQGMTRQFVVQYEMTIVEVFAKIGSFQVQHGCSY